MAYLKFPMPEGFTPPEGAEKGTFEALATLEMEEGGTLCLVAIDGIPLGSEESEEPAPEGDEYEEATAPDTGDFEKAMAMGLSR
jgi:hypothetical protein